MAKKFVKKYMPDPKKIRENKYLKIFGSLLHKPQLWAINKNTIARAFSVGLFFAYVPVPFQMFLAAGIAIIFKANLPLSVALVWISNPVTMPFLYPLAYLLGAWILGSLPQDFSFAVIYSTIVNNPSEILYTFLFGCLIHGVVLGTLGNITIRIFWRYHLYQSFLARRKKSREKKLSKKTESELSK